MKNPPDGFIQRVSHFQSICMYVLRWPICLTFVTRFTNKHKKSNIANAEENVLQLGEIFIDLHKNQINLSV